MAYFAARVVRDLEILESTLNLTLILFLFPKMLGIASNPYNDLCHDFSHRITIKAKYGHNIP